MPTFNARRNHLGNYKLLVDGQTFGTMYLHEGKVTGGWFRDQEVKDAFRRISMNTPCAVLADYLFVARRAWEVVAEDRDARDAAEAKADWETDLAVERFFENRMSDEDKAREDEEYANDPWLQALCEGRR
jgi:hypothetical protein